MATTITIIIVSLLFSAFFSGMEIAFVTSNRLRIEVEKSQGTFSSRIISIFTKKPGLYISTMLVGNNIALVIYGIFMAILLKPAIENVITNEWLILLIQTILSTLIILITAEFLPKTLFRLQSNNALRIFAPPVFLFFILFYPITIFTIWLSDKVFGRVLGVKMSKKQNQVLFGKVDLDDFINRAKKDKKKIETGIDTEIKIFQNALEFSKVKIRECIVPRTEIVAIEVDKPLEELKQKFIDTGFSKILIYEETIDNIIGYFHVADLFRNPKTIKSKLQKLEIVPETMTANKMLGKFIQSHKSIALVVDEFGGTAGIVTIEDIIEEIFGEIEDEHDSIELTDKQISKNEYLFSGRLEIDHINEKYELDITTNEDYETIAGYILFHHQSIPQVNEKIEIGNFAFQITKVSKNRIVTVRLEVKKGDILNQL